MTVYILFLLAFVSLLIGVGIFGVQKYKLEKGLIVRSPDYNGPESLKLALFALLRILSRRIVLLQRLIGAHTLHFFVLIMRFFDKITSHFYSRSRNLFVKSAIKNKSTVPHFWEYLKTYKQEIDKEKKEKNE